LAESRLEDFTSPFSSIHALIVFAKSGFKSKANVLIKNMEAFAKHDSGLLGSTYQQVLVPVSEAFIAFVEDRPRQVLEKLLPIRFLLYRMGGSHAQRDLFWQVMTRSALQLDDKGLLKQLRSEIKNYGFCMLDQRRTYSGVF
jgi:hypothetical protein